MRQQTPARGRTCSAVRAAAEGGTGWGRWYSGRWPWMSSAARKEYLPKAKGKCAVTLGGGHRREKQGSRPSCIGPSKLTQRSSPIPKLGPVSGVQFSARSSGCCSVKMVCLWAAYLPAVNSMVPNAGLHSPADVHDVGVNLGAARA